MFFIVLAVIKNIKMDQLLSLNFRENGRSVKIESFIKLLLNAFLYSIFLRSSGPIWE